MLFKSNKNVKGQRKCKFSIKIDCFFLLFNNLNSFIIISLNKIIKTFKNGLTKNHLDEVKPGIDDFLGIINIDYAMYK